MYITCVFRPWGCTHWAGRETYAWTTTPSWATAQEQVHSDEEPHDAAQYKGIMYAISSLAAWAPGGGSWPLSSCHGCQEGTWGPPLILRGRREGLDRLRYAVDRLVPSCPTDLLAEGEGYPVTPQTQHVMISADHSWSTKKICQNMAAV